MLILLSVFLPKDRASADRAHILGGPEEDTSALETGSSTPGDTLGALFSVGGVDNLGETLGSLDTYRGNSIALSSLHDVGDRFSGGGTTIPALLTYTVAKGDTLSQIAVQFGTSVAALKEENPAIKTGIIKKGQELSIAVSPAALATATAKAAGAAAAKPAAVVAAATKSAPALASVSATLSSAASEAASSPYIMPVEGFNWGILHGHNGVDIANSCGTTIVAAADGLVIPDGICESDDGWNGGYGRCVTLQHDNGTKTKYAHMSQVSVELGEYVKQGDPLGKMGSTGKSTGCHLHFEVRGATNPFAKS